MVNGTAHATGLHYRRLMNVTECIDTPSLALRPRYIVKLALHMRAFSRVIPTLGSPRRMEELRNSIRWCSDEKNASRYTSEKEGSLPVKFCSPDGIGGELRMWWFCDSVRVVLECTDGGISSRSSTISSGVIERKRKLGSIVDSRKGDRRQVGKEYERGGVGEQT
jgi:hypothetical protein